MQKRKPTRLKAYDYNQTGAYFITICAWEKKKLFGNIIGDGFDVPQMELSNFGKTVQKQIMEIQEQYAAIKMDRYVIMPNHLHMILIIDGKSRDLGHGTSKCLV